MSETYSTRYTLLQRAKSQSDSNAWEELIGQYRRYIYVIIRSMNVNDSDTEDVLQLILVQLWKYLPKYEYDPEKAKFRSWVATVTRTQVINFIKKQQTHSNKLNKAEPSLKDDYLDSIKHSEIDKIAQQEWETFIATTAIQNISPKFSSRAVEAFELYSKGMKVEQIAKELDVKVDSVYKYISRVKVKLIEEIQVLKKDLDF